MNATSLLMLAGIILFTKLLLWGVVHTVPSTNIATQCPSATFICRPWLQPSGGLPQGRGLHGACFHGFGIGIVLATQARLGNTLGHVALYVVVGGLKSKAWVDLLVFGLLGWLSLFG